MTPTSAQMRQARRRVDDVHLAAARRPDPVAYLRAAQLEAEARWFEHGDRDSLALVRAFEESLVLA